MPPTPTKSSVLFDFQSTSLCHKYLPQSLHNLRLMMLTNLLIVALSFHASAALLLAHTTMEAMISSLMTKPGIFMQNFMAITSTNPFSYHFHPTSSSPLDGTDAVTYAQNYSYLPKVATTTTCYAPIINVLSHYNAQSHHKLLNLTTISAKNSTLYALHHDTKISTPFSRLCLKLTHNPSLHKSPHGSLNQNAPRPPPHHLTQQHELRIVLLSNSWLCPFQQRHSPTLPKSYCPSLPSQLYLPPFHPVFSQPQQLCCLWHLYLLCSFMSSKSQDLFLFSSHPQQSLSPYPPSSKTTITTRHQISTTRHPTISFLYLNAASTHFFATKYHQPLGTWPQLHRPSLSP